MIGLLGTAWFSSSSRSCAGRAGGGSLRIGSDTAPAVVTIASCLHRCSRADERRRWRKGCARRSWSARPHRPSLTTVALSPRYAGFRQADAKQECSARLKQDTIAMRFARTPPKRTPATPVCLKADRRPTLRQNLRTSPAGIVLPRRRFSSHL